MEKTVYRVFAILMWTIILIFLLDTTLIVMSFLGAYNKIGNVMDIAQAEVASHNCITKTMAKNLDNQLEDVMQTTISKAIIPQIATNYTTQERNITKDKIGNPLKNRLDSPITYNVSGDGTKVGGTQFTQRVDEQNVGEYGDIKTIEVRFNFQPMMIYLPNSKMFSATNKAGMSETWNPVPVTIKRTVPCLRYVK